MENNNKCDKYEGLFVFRTDEELKEHLKKCPDCQAEHEKLLKVSKLVKEVAPVYLAKKKKEKTILIKRIACCFAFFAILTSVTGYQLYDNYNLQEASLDEESCISTQGLPTDDYGFFEI